jgi:ferrous iron transport protein A
VSWIVREVASIYIVFPYPPSLKSYGGTGPGLSIGERGKLGRIPQTKNTANFIQRHYMPAPQPLTSVGLGAVATVAQINVPAGSRARLMEMGLLVGTKVELVRFAPMGDPVEIKVRGYNLTLRKSEAEQILVNPV